MNRTFFTAVVVGAAVATATADVTYSDQFDSGATLDAGWTATSGTWAQDDPADALTADDGGNNTHTISHSALAVFGGTPTYSAFSLSLDFKFTNNTTPEEDWAGLAWNIGGSATDEFYGVRIRRNNGRATLTRFTGGGTGTIHIQKSNDAGFSDLGELVEGNLYRITVESSVAGTFSASIIDVTGGDINLITLSGTDAGTAITGGNLGIYSRDSEPDDLQITAFTGTVPDPPDPGMAIQSSFSIRNNGAAGTISLPFTNFGANENLVIGSVTLVGDPEFVHDTSSSPVPAGQTGTIDLIFTPASIGFHTTTMTVVSNDPSELSRDIDVEVTVIDPWISVDPDELDFGVFSHVPSPVSAAIAVTNLGANEDLTIASAPFISGPDFDSFTVTTTGGFPLVIPPGGSADLDIEFSAAKSIGLFSASLEIDSDDFDNPVPVITLAAEIRDEHFDSWAAGFGISNDENDDSDLDGIPALVEYGLGYDPTDFDTLPLPVPSGADHTVTWPKGSQAASDPEISYAPEVSTDLVTWTSPAPGDLTESGTELVLTLTGGQEKIFGRLKVIRAAP